jgi:hypothetical protein
MGISVLETLLCLLLMWPDLPMRCIYDILQVFNTGVGGLGMAKGATGVMDCCITGVFNT